MGWYAIPTRGQGPQEGDRAGRGNPHWVERATFGHDTGGYEQWESRPDQAVVGVHRLAAVAWFGFEAVSDMDVHHGSGVPWDNREENIELLSHADHTRLHAQERADALGD